MANEMPVFEGKDSHVKTMVWKTGGEGRTPEESIAAYNIWAQTYEQDVLSSIYNGPEMVGNCVAELYPPEVRDSVRILDVAAGTGLVGRELKKHCFTNVDGLDPSPGMLEVAKANGRYENYIEAYINDKQLDIPENTYDALTGCGIFCEGGHAPVEGLYEMIRLVKPGGYIVLMTRVNVVEQTEIYKDLEPLMRKLEDTGTWQWIKRDTSMKHYSDRQGILFLFKVL